MNPRSPRRAQQALRFIPLSLCVIWLTLSGCRRRQPLPPPPITTTAAPAILNLGVTGSAAAFADLVSEPFAQDNDRAVVNFVVANNATLFADLENGQLDAILVHHIPEGSGMWFNPVALDGLVVVVHPENSVSTLNLAQIQAIFSNRLGNWADVGGADTPVILNSRERGSGSRLLFNQRIMAEQRVSINALVQPSNRTLLDAVAADRNAVGYSMMGAISSSVVPLAIDGQRPSIKSTASQDYPLTVPLYFVAPAEPRGPLRAFLAWLQSDAGQSIVGEKYGRVR